MGLLGMLGQSENDHSTVQHWSARVLPSIVIKNMDEPSRCAGQNAKQ
jgi:hypothetical protein